MSGMPKQRRSLSPFSNATRKAFMRSASALGRSKILPRKLRNQLNRLGKDKHQNQPNNRRKKTTPELQEYIKSLQSEGTSKRIVRDFRELAHYAYVFDIEHYKSQLELEEAGKLQSIGDVILHYCTSGCREGIDPSNLFETENYLSKYPDVKASGLNPMVHCFKFGMNERRFSMDNIHFMRKMADIKRAEKSIENSIIDDLKGKRVGVFLHIFYPELGETIASYLKNIPCRIDVFISTKEDSIQILKHIFSQVDNAQKVEVRHFSNIGRDVAPFIVGFKDEIPNYDLILKLHSKKSPHSNALSGWFLHCLDNLIGSKTIAATNLKALQSPDIGIVYPVENYALSLGIKHDSCWGHEDGNYTKASPFLKRFNLDHITRDSQFRFPTGTMFWCKPDLLRPILDWNLSWHDFDEEGGQIDGTIAHSIERLIGLSTTEICNQKLLTTYCGYFLSKQHLTDKSIIEGRNKLKIQGFEKVIQFKSKELDPDWSLKNNTNPKSLHIHWVIPNFTPGLGGHMTIFRTIDYLERCGHQCTIWVHSELKGNDKPSRLSSLHKRVIDQAFIPLKTDQVYMLGNNQDDLDRVSGDIVIATDRMSTYPVLGMKKFQKRFYFVQDYEAYFFARGSSSILTEQSYASENNFSCICASPWLKQKMESFGNSAISFPLAVDHDVYHPDNTQKRSSHAIAFYVRRSTPRRLYELGLLALRALFDLGDYFEIITFGETDLPDLGIPVKVKHAGILEADDLANLYRQCTVGFVLSGTNYSLVPNEMMACGLPVVDIDAEHTRVSYQPETAVLAKATPADLASALSLLLNDSTFRARTTRAGLAATEHLNWDSSNKLVEAYIQESLPSAPTSQHLEPAVPLVTIVVPVYNGGAMLRAVVESCLAQDLDQPFEVLLIDSESSDGCLDGLPEDERLRLHKIRKKDFGHGRTRNLGVKLARGEYVAFITQDAIPANRMWLMNLIAPLQKDPGVAGVFGCHMAHTTHGQLTAHDLDQHFNRWIFRSHRQPIELEVGRQTSNGVVSSHERFYSDNNSCLRKSICETLPLPDVVYGEDQLWAREILRRGYKKAYASTAVVRHSHEYGFRETVIRANTEWHFYNQLLGEKLPSTKQEVLQMIERSCANDKKAQELYPDITNDDLISRRRLHFARACGYYLAAKGHGSLRP
ncbi:rhamnan synthesis F family protein [Synechococcus sp. KORDI-52]|uniref:rhamnosyltransferase WsaF family glycosyltransferase n=1 Tax=Synechococcus sp. KORDI-52 TaxID=585425 RepID=UPI0005703776|nr:rhamnan synthesis F family protein [Synechococcus sp. KORDI-52]